MIRSRAARSIILFVALVLPPAAAAQSRFETPKGTVEVIGLRRWTVQMIQDSAAKYAPGQDLASHACAAVLRFKLGFADAAVSVQMPSTPGGKTFTTVTVVEPQDSALVAYRNAPTGVQRVPATWDSVVALFQAHNEDFQFAVQIPGMLTADTAPTRFGPVSPTASALRSLIRADRSPGAFRLAVQAALTDSSVFHRLAAVVMLQGFADQDEAWRVLAEAQRDPMGIIDANAEMSLSALALGMPGRKVDWRPVAPTLRLLLNGTHTFGLDHLMRVLATTKVDPALAPTLLGGNGRLVLDRIGATDEIGRRAAMDLLRQLSGLDHGTDVAAWQHWIDGLPVLNSHTGA